MMLELPILERAFYLAASGELESVQELRRRLAKEGYTEMQLAQLSMPALRRQLRKILSRQQEGWRSSPFGRSA